MSRKLNNYLRMHRKRTGLSQQEMAFLLGCRSGAKVSRYEHFARCPILQTVFVYEVIFQMPARELFAGMFQEVERTTRKRAQVLERTLATANSDRLTARKVALLKSVASLSVSEPTDQS